MQQLALSHYWGYSMVHLLQKKVSVSSKVKKMYLPISQQFHSRYLTQENKNIYPQKKHAQEYSSQLHS